MVMLRMRSAFLCDVIIVRVSRMVTARTSPDTLGKRDTGSDVICPYKEC